VAETPEKLRLGGMALRNGLLVHGPTHWAAAIRTADGSLEVASGPKPRLHAFDRVPGARGLARLYEAIAVLPPMRRALPQAQMPFQDSRVVAGAVAAGVAGVAARGAAQRAGRATLGEAAAAGLSLAPSLLALRAGELAQYHGVEHKAIAAYEHGEADASWTTGDEHGSRGGRTSALVASAAKEHERCGSHLVAPMLAANVAGAALLRRVVERPGPLAAGAVGLASLAAAVEVFAWSERHAGTRAARALRRPGYELQRLIGTREPDERQLEVGRAALAEILRVEGGAART
jgi:uncharacterized protein YqhQ